MKKQIKVTVDEDLYNLLCKNSIKELGEINLSLFTKILYNKHVKKVENILLKSEIIKLKNKGLSYSEIGEIFGISRQAVHKKVYPNKK